MKIVTIGHAGVGKTTYMASLYYAMQQGYEGFTLRAANAEDAAYLQGLGEHITVGQYPESTAKRSQYHLVLQHNRRDVIDFYWADYAGGAIDRYASDEQKALLLKDLQQADGVMMLCDCSEMTPNWIGANSPIGKHVGKMSTLFTTAIPHLTHPISLAIMLTKVDLVKTFKEKMLDPLEGVLRAAEVSPKVNAALIPVACGTTFVNVPMPLLFALHAAVEQRSQSLLTSLKASEVVAAQEEEKSHGFTGFFDEVGGWLFSYKTHREKAADERTKAAQLRQEQNTVAQSLAAISLQARQLPLLQKGTPTYEYVSRVAQSVDKPAHRRNFLNIG